MNKEHYTSGDTLCNITTNEIWKIVMVDDESNQLIISHDTNTMVVNITNLDVDYNIIK